MVSSDDKKSVQVHYLRLWQWVTGMISPSALLIPAHHSSVDKMHIPMECSGKAVCPGTWSSARRIGSIYELHEVRLSGLFWQKK